MTASVRHSVPLPQRTRFQPRRGILDEVVAGLLWMQLDLPEDISRAEMEDFARRLVGQVKAGAGEAMMAGEIARLQAGQFCRPADLPAIRALARRVMTAVQGG